ncbi:MAG: hypothetical protein U1E10_19195 [Bdellovibrionales bacterium]|nr:hypothetical protein [Bdellovibrionales bacterium]
MKTASQLIAKLCLAIVLSTATAIGFAPVSQAQEADTMEFMSLEEMAYAATDLDAAELEAMDAELYASRWDGGYDRPYRPRPPRYRGVQCRAVNARGVAFYGRGPNMPAARDAALDRCYQVSRRCYMDGCQPL